jgi:hypothetical protein
MMLSNLATFTVALGMLATSADAPQWHTDYGKALKETRSENRPLLVVIDNTKDKEQQVDEALLDGQGESKLASYELCRVDASSEYGQKVAKAFKAEKFPYVAIIDKQGEVILHSQSGAVSETSWNAMLEKHEAGVRPVKVTKPVTASTYPSEYPSDYSYPTTTRPYCAKCQRGY